MRFTRLNEQLHDLLDEAEELSRQYDKYKCCFSVSSIDQEMSGNFQRIKLSYVKTLSLMSFKRGPSGAAATVAIDHCDCVVAEKPIIFFRIRGMLKAKISSFSDIQLHSGITLAIHAEIDKISLEVNRTKHIVERMELMIRGSQQIYQTSSVPRISA